MNHLTKPYDSNLREKLDRMKRWPSLKEKWNGCTVRIWSAQWGAYWRPGGRGYTEHLEDAGEWSFENAYASTKHCGREKQIQFERV